jgi:hypothetical protein
MKHCQGGIAPLPSTSTNDAASGALPPAPLVFQQGHGSGSGRSSPSGSEDDNSDTDVSTKSDSSSSCSVAVSSPCPTGGNNAKPSDPDEKATKEMLRKERRREAVRLCRKRKREAALKLEAQFKFQRQRQAVLVRELQRKSQTSGAASMGLPAPPPSYNDNSHMMHTMRLQAAMHAASANNPAVPQQQALSSQLSRLLMQAERMKHNQAVFRSSSMLFQQQPQPHFGLAPAVPTMAFPKNSNMTMMEELLLRRSLEASAAVRAPSPCSNRSAAMAANNSMATLLAVAEQEQELVSRPQTTQTSYTIPPLVPGPLSMPTSFTAPSALAPVAMPALETMAAEAAAPPLKKLKLDPGMTEEEKELKRKERKREAVRRCRLRKREQQERLQQETMKMLQQNEKLQSSLLMTVPSELSQQLPTHHFLSHQATAADCRS